MNILPALFIDAYKAFHHQAYHPAVTHVYSNFTNRFGKYSNTDMDEVVFFGLQYFLINLHEKWNKNFFEKDEDFVVSEYERVISSMLGTKADGEHIRKLHKLGYLPLQVKALPEGSLVPYGIPCVTITNTNPDFYWLPNLLETTLSANLWPMSTSATTAFAFRKRFEAEPSLDKGFIPFMAHDFSYRGMMGDEAALMSGLGHLTSFVGSDTVPAALAAEKYYGADMTKELVFASVNATEHSVMCSYGQEGELASLKHLLLNVAPEGILSVVSDTWDFWKLVTEYLPELKDIILERNGTLVIRPDCYDEETQVLTNSGFKFFKDLEEADLVAQILNDGSYEFVKPLKYVKQFYEGDMYHFTDHHGKVDLLVTPNHRMIVNVNGKERVIFAEDMVDSGHHYQKMKRSARQGSFYSNSRLTDYERLMIAFQADGSYQTRSNKIRFSFSKQRKMTRLEKLLDSQEINYAKYYLKDGRVEYSVDVNAEDFHKDFSWVQVSDISYKYAQDFIEELSYWDATRRSDGRFKFDTTNKDVIKTVELIAIAAGYGILVSEAEDARKEIFSDVYTAHIVKNNEIGGRSWIKTKREGFSGTVYCVQVPSGKLLVKRNRCTMVCGNSGDPVKILTGYKSHEYVDMGEGELYETQCIGYDYYPNYSKPITQAEQKGLIECLWDIFEGTITDSGMKQLDSHLGAIYGDSITLERQDEIIRRLVAKGFVPSVVLGVGSYTYQHVTRDTHGSAMKATCVQKGEGNYEPIFKQPKTDSKKNSAKGLMCVIKKEDGTFSLSEDVTPEVEASELNKLKTVYLDGMITSTCTLSEIRSRINENFK